MRTDRRPPRDGLARSHGAGSPDPVSRDAVSRDAVPSVALAVALAAGGAAAWVLGEHLLSVPLRVLGGLLVAAAAVPIVLAVVGGHRRRTIVLAVAVAAALATTGIPALMHRPGPVRGTEIDGLAPLGPDDQAVSVPRASSAGTATTSGSSAGSASGPSAILVRRADGTAQLVAPDGSSATDLGAAAGDVAALTADARYVVVVHDGATRIAPVDDPGSARTVHGRPIAVVEDVLVVRACADSLCEERGIDLSAEPPTGSGADADGDPLWAVDVDPGAPAAASEGEPLTPGAPGRPVEDVGRATGILPAAIVRPATGQGWFWVDPATGFWEGRLIAPDDAACTAVAPASFDDAGRTASVLGVCTAADGAVTVSAHAGGAPLWESDPSPAGELAVRAERGRVLAAGPLADGTETQLVLTEARAEWTVPGGDRLAGDGPYAAQLGLDGSVTVYVTADGEAFAADIATGATIWDTRIGDDAAPLRGSLEHGTAVLIDDAPRTSALAPAAARRLRVVTDDGREGVRQDAVRAPTDVRPVADGRAPVVDGDRVVLVGA